MNSYIDQLPDALKRTYQELTSDEDSANSYAGSPTSATKAAAETKRYSPSVVKSGHAARLNNLTSADQTAHDTSVPGLAHGADNEGPLMFGFIPASIMARLQDESNA